MLRESLGSLLFQYGGSEKEEDIAFYTENTKILKSPTLCLVFSFIASVSSDDFHSPNDIFWLMSCFKRRSLVKD